MSVALRAHHLLCVLTYVGRGYSEAFIANYDVVARRLTAGEPIRLVAGPDDICAPLLVSEAEPTHCLRQSVVERDAAALEEISALLGWPLAVDDTFSLDAGRLALLRQAFRNGQVRRACADCQWNALCTAVAHGGYRSVRVRDSRAGNEHRGGSDQGCSTPSQNATPD